jgi:predicted small lipoprotein YifL
MYCYRFLSSVLVAALLSVAACKQKAPAVQPDHTQNGIHQDAGRIQASGRPTTQTPYKVYQGVGDIGEQKGGRVCFVYGKDEHCWNAEDGFSEVKAKPINLSSGRRLILVSALSMGGSDGTIDLALIEEQNRQPVNLLQQVEIASANAGQWDDWLIEDISPMPIILIAEPEWSADSNISNAEERALAHQYGITVYTYYTATAQYGERFSYVTSRKYDRGDVIALEKTTILAKLKSTTTQ